MSQKSSIEWTDATWNPVAGCSVVSPGCTNCYAMRRVAPRLSANSKTPHYAGTVQPSKAGPVWTGKIGIAGDAVLTAPLRWKRPRRIFVNSTSDLFHPGVPDEVIDRIFAVMALCPQHVFQVLTKRPERMREYVTELMAGRRQLLSAATDLRGSLLGALVAANSLGMLCAVDLPAEAGLIAAAPTGPLPNVWLGTSVEDQQRADERIPHLLSTPAAVRFISAEPLLGPVDLSNLRQCTECGNTPAGLWLRDPLADPSKPWPGNRCPLHYTDDSCDGILKGVDLVIVGGESGNGARPMHPDWARSLRDQCAAAGVPFFFKQWGEWGDFTEVEPKPVAIEDRIFAPSGKVLGVGTDHGRKGAVDPDWRQLGGAWMLRLKKSTNGRLLDGIEHNAMPEIRP